MEEENKLRQTGTDREEISEAQYKIMLCQDWLESYYYGRLGENLFVFHFFEMSDVYEGLIMKMM